MSRTLLSELTFPAPPSCQSASSVSNLEVPLSELVIPRATRKRKLAGTSSASGEPDPQEKAAIPVDVVVETPLSQLRISTRLRGRVGGKGKSEPAVLTANANDSASVVNGPERLEPWLDDGNIILAVEGKHFRVHRSVLSLYSEVFKDMFSAPHAGDTEDEAIDGCPVVYLQDAAADVEILLKALYDRSFVFFPETLMPVNVLVAFLRMGKKYIVRQLFEEAKRRISFGTPLLERASTICAAGGMTLFPGITGTDTYNFMIINAANEAGLLSTTLIAVIRCCLTCPALSIVDGYDLNGVRCSLSTSSKRYCLLVQNHLAEVDRQLFESLSYPAPTCPIRGSSQSACNAGILATLRTLQYPKRPFTTWMGSWDSGLCSVCRIYLRSKYEEVRTKLWKDLPTKIGLGSWEKIDRDAEIV